MENNLPKGWVETSLNELLITFESGSRPRGGVRGIKDGIPSFGGEHLNYNGKFNFENVKYVPKEFAVNMNQGRISFGDILIVKDGATTGKTAYVDETFPFDNAVVNEHVFVCKPSQFINSRYLFWFLWSEEGNKRILENFKGSAQGGINKTFAPNTFIPLAPKKEQDRIVQKLDVILQKVNTSKARLERIPLLLKNMRQSILAAAVSSELINTDIINWNKVKLIDVILEKPKNGYSAKPVKYETKYRVLTLTATTSGKFNPNHYKYFDEAIAPTSSFWLQPNDILLQRGNTIEYVGVPAIYDGQPNKFIYPDLMMRVRANENIVLNKFLYFILASEASRNFLRERATGTAGNMPKINQPTLMSLPVAFPSLQEQNEIVRKVEELFAFADTIEARYEKAKAYFAKIPQAILSKAFKCELVKQDENDEPASELLKRIKQQKQATTKPKTKQPAKRYKMHEGEDEVSMVAEGD